MLEHNTFKPAMRFPSLCRKIVRLSGLTLISHDSVKRSCESWDQIPGPEELLNECKEEYEGKTV